MAVEYFRSSAKSDSLSIQLEEVVLLKIKVYFEAKKSGLEAEVGGLAGGQKEQDFEPRGGPGKKPKFGDKRSDGCMKKKNSTWVKNSSSIFRLNA